MAIYYLGFWKKHLVRLGMNQMFTLKMCVLDKQKAHKFNLIVILQYCTFW